MRPGVRMVQEIVRWTFRIWSWFRFVLLVLSSVSIAVLTLPIVYNVIARKAGHPTIWSFEISLYIMTTAVYLAVAPGLTSGTHFRVTLLRDVWPKARPYLEVISKLIVLTFGVSLAVAGWEFAATSLATNRVSNTSLHVPLFLPQVFVPIGGLALAIEAFRLLFLQERDRHEEAE